MPLLFHIEKPLSVATGNGSYDGVTPSTLQGFVRHIIVKAITASTIFDFAIQDTSGFELYSRESIDGELNELTDLPIKGSAKLKIRNATVDESFTIYLAIQEP